SSNLSIPGHGSAAAGESLERPTIGAQNPRAAAGPALLLRSIQLDPELAQLALVEWRRGAGQEIDAWGGLREGNHVPDRLVPREQRGQAMDAERDPPVRRGPMRKR